MQKLFWSWIELRMLLLKVVFLIWYSNPKLIIRYSSYFLDSWPFFNAINLIVLNVIKKFWLLDLNLNVKAYWISTNMLLNYSFIITLLLTLLPSYYLALCVSMHRLQKFQTFCYGLFLKNLGVFRIRETHIWSFWCIKVVFLTTYFSLLFFLFLGFHQNSIVKIHKLGSVFNSGIVY